ncbi:MAG: methionyl-tRNA formyltransferase [Phycisphaerae bacterium]|jgi:methionyl-tRNA formyltransferase|nr:methionyl-tRNA formyltransferase [Phycisphaerae bacterium]
MSPPGLDPRGDAAGAGAAERRLRLVFLGSGSFGLPTLHAIGQRHDVALVISQPDRPAGRGRAMTPTPIAAWAQERNIPVRKPERANESIEVSALRAVGADAFVVIAFGQKLSSELLGTTFAINLHASLLPAYRGAAPINWAMMDGLDETGVSVISLAQRMDAGLVYARRTTAIEPTETCGELHDRLATMGPEAVLATLGEFARGSLVGESQDESRVSKARKLSREDGRIDVTGSSARALRGWIHGLTPWPGCDVQVGGQAIRLLRVRDHAEGGGEPGTIQADRTIACASGRLEVLELQPPGGRAMTLDAFCAGRRWESGMRVTRVSESKVGG